MKRRGACSRGGRKRNKPTTRTNNNNNKTPPLPPVLGTVATRTRRQKREVATRWKEPISILITILRYADPETIRQACCVSKQFRDLIYHDPGMAKNRVVPLLEFRPSEDAGDEDDHEDRLGRLGQQLYHHRDKLQRYVTLRMIDSDKFMCSDLRTTTETMTEQLRLNGIVSFEMAGEGHNHRDHCGIIPYFLSHILPNLQEINFSITVFRYQALSAFSARCTRLEKVTWNNVNESSLVSISGADIQKATNLREIYMDESNFHHQNLDWRCVDLENNLDRFVFYKCGSTVLERVSIRNAKWYGFDHDEDPIIIPQNALIKFVRNAPKSLRWFRSNLTTENISMLRSERPEIELVN